MSKKRYEIVSYDIPLWLKPVLSVTETSIYTGISANKIYEMSESEDCPFVIWIGSRRVIKRKSFEEYLERQYSIFSPKLNKERGHTFCIVGVYALIFYQSMILSTKVLCSVAVLRK